MKWKRLTLTVLCVALVGAEKSAFGAPQAEDTGKSERMLLQIDPGGYGSYRPGSIWRCHETWQSELVRLDSGELGHTDPYQFAVNPADAQRRKGLGYVFKTTDKIKGSSFPPADWPKTDFDDGAWLRRGGVFLSKYRSLALVCLRGKFHVSDPGAVEKLQVSMKFMGGAVIYLNGKEVGRAFLPEGKITFDTPAQDYPLEAYLQPDGKIMGATEYPGNPRPSTWAWDRNYTDKSLAEELKARYLKRFRDLKLTLPSSHLRKGVNVLAVEVHRAPAPEVMFIKAAPHDLLRSEDLWNRNAIETLEFKATAPAGAITPNVSRPKGFQVWNADIFVNEANPESYYGDPNETLQPLRLSGVRNATHTGQVIVSSTDPIHGLKVTVSDLAGKDGGEIPASTISLGFPQWVNHYGTTGYDEFDPEPPPEIKPFDGSRNYLNRPAFQPVWVSVRVPRDAKAGRYSGAITIKASGEKTVSVPLDFRVSGEWVMPDPENFTTHLGVAESPQSLAMYYKVPLWSEEHWKLLDRMFALLGEIGTKDLYIQLTPRSHFGNEHSMLQWIRQADGSYKYDFTIVERYLDTALKHMKNIPVICLYLNDQDGGTAYPRPRDPVFTELDLATGELKEQTAPQWGTPESRAFWKPVVQGMHDILAKRGVEKSMMFGLTGEFHSPPRGCLDDIYECVSTLKGQVLPPRWVYRSHSNFPRDWLRRSGKADIGCMSALLSGVSVLWEPGEQKPVYGWRDPYLCIAAPREPRKRKGGPSLNNASLCWYRISAEGILLSYAGDGDMTMRGIGYLGADFWPVMEGGRGGGKKSLSMRFGIWGATGIESVVPVLLAAGKDGPLHSCRSRMLLESLQEAEARVFVQNALLDDQKRAKLGDQLTKRCEKVCDDRTRAFRYLSEYHYAYVMNPTDWEAQSEKLFELTGEVAKALGN